MVTETLTPVEAPASPPVETTKPMKLSEAMRLGSIATAQAVGAWHEETESGDAMCAISTAWYALTGETEKNAGDSTLLELLRTRFVDNPIGGQQQPLASVIITLNDDYHWDRQRIASWLETLGL